MMLAVSTGIQCLALLTMASASMAPNPKELETLKLAALVIHPVPPDRFEGSDVYAMRYWMSLHERLGLSKVINVCISGGVAYFTCSTSAMTPANSGADALVPVKFLTHSLSTCAVTCK